MTSGRKDCPAYPTPPRNPATAGRGARGRLSNNVKPADGKAASKPSRQQVLSDAAFLRNALEPNQGEDGASAQGPPILVVLSGLPGTGKSYFGRELVKLAPFFVLESDRVRKLLVANPKYTPGEHSRVFNVCHLLIEDYLARGRRVLFDATNLTESFRRPLYQICDRLSVPLTLLRFTAPLDTVRRRLADRAGGLHPEDNSDADWLIHCRLSPNEEPIQRQHLGVDSSADISQTLKDVANLAMGQP